MLEAYLQMVRLDAAITFIRHAIMQQMLDRAEQVPGTTWIGRKKTHWWQRSAVIIARHRYVWARALCEAAK